MKIGELAARAGVSVDTVRFYEKRGLLPAPRRRASGYRTYTDQTLQRLRLVKFVQSLGLGLDEIGEVLTLLDQGTASCENQRPRLRAVVDRLDREIAELVKVRSRVAGFLESCVNGHCELAGKRAG